MLHLHHNTQPPPVARSVVSASAATEPATGQDTIIARNNEGEVKIHLGSGFLAGVALAFGLVVVLLVLAPQLFER